MSETTSTSGGGGSETTPTSGGGVSWTAATSEDAGNELVLPSSRGRILSGQELRLDGLGELRLLLSDMSRTTAVYTQAHYLRSLQESVPNLGNEFDDEFEDPPEESEQGDVVSISSSDVLDDASDEPAPHPSPPSSTSASDVLDDASYEPAPQPSPPSSENSAS